MKKVISVLAACLFIFIAGSEPDIVTPYLAEHCHSLDLEHMDLSLLGSDIDSQVFLSGAQWHGSVANYDMHYALLTALYEQAGVRYLLLDSGYATAQVYNDYLQSGKTDLLNMALSGIRFSNMSCNEHRLFWERLYQYNKALPPGEKIVVVGIDIEFQLSTAFNFLYHLSDNQLGNLYPPTEYLGVPEALNRYLTGLQAKYLEDPQPFINAFGDNIGRFELAVQNLMDTVSVNLNDNYYAEREKLMYANFLSAYNNDPQGKYFGHFTMEHIYQRNVKIGELANADRFATLLVQEDSPVRDRVISIAAMYHDSEFRFYFGRYETYRVMNSYIVDAVPLLKNVASDYTLYKLNGVESPFSWDTFTVNHPSGGVTTDYYQYLLLIQHSQSTSPNLLSPPH